MEFMPFERIHLDKVKEYQQQFKELQNKQIVQLIYGFSIKFDQFRLYTKY